MGPRASSAGRARLLSAKSAQQRFPRYLAGLATGLLIASSALAVGEQAFDRWREALWPEAQALGVSRTTFDRVFRGVEPDLSLPDLLIPGQKKSDAKGQAEFTKPPQHYLAKTHLLRLAEQGKGFLVQHAESLVRIEQELGVERHIVLGIWGRETAYGNYRLPHYAIKALATQAYLGRRKDFFRKELLNALKMLEDRLVTPETMRSSWAGAMGLPQFMPSEFYLYAYDLDKDGKKDLWSSVPDALGSAAKQLKDKGWITGLPWGFEVKLPAALDCSSEGPGAARPLGDRARLGVSRTRGRQFHPEHLSQSAYLMMPGGTNGPAFLVTENFLVIKRYNMSDLYALFVGHLADRIAGGGDFETPWRDITQLSAVEVEEMQERLKGLGFAIDKIDGKVGSVTRKEIGLYQKRSRLPVDCWPSATVLAKMRGLAARP